MYKKYLLIIGLISFVGTAQEAVHNYGNIQIHNNTSVGFHTNLINDGAFDQNMGLVGFYSETGDISISGAFTPVFYDAEVALEGGLLLDTPIGVNNNANLITGDIVTSKSQASVYSNFMDYSFYTGESSVSKINGYGAMTNKETFMFPVGDDNRLRPLTIESVAINAIAKCAYFFEDPNNSKSLNNNFNTQDKATEFISVSDKEFWRLEGDVPSRVTLTWDEWSNVRALGEFVSDLKVVGWDKAENQWVNLGNTNVTGGMIYGTITSEEIVPNDYEIITIGGNDSDLETYSTIDLDNYFMTPNGDGQNDILELDGVEESPNNLLQIFDRYGVLVYSKNNYQNEFNGRSNRETVVTRDSGLPSGIYFYIITMNDLRQKHQGYLYISN
ncbi:MAG: gliding motility-associated C-terminal domain-containing protein [Muriicola sp.]|nr:gliding motility-associated C-terminal domain-containing protein [Muriicola sp.]